MTSLPAAALKKCKALLACTLSLLDTHIYNFMQAKHNKNHEIKINTASINTLKESFKRPNNVHYVHFGYIGQATDTTWGSHLREAGTRPPGHAQGRSPGQQVLTRRLRRP